MLSSSAELSHLDEVARVSSSLVASEVDVSEGFSAPESLVSEEEAAQVDEEELVSWGWDDPTSAEVVAVSEVVAAAEVVVVEASEEAAAGVGMLSAESQGPLNK